MGGTPHRIENWAAREEVLAADLIRAQLLASKMVQDAAGDLAADGAGVVIASLDAVPSWTATAGFTATLGLGRGHVFSTTGVTADDSNFQVIEWPATPLTFSTPDPTNPRIDLIVATPATQAQDIVARNVLLDPVARTQGLVNVAKTSQPFATIAVVTGTPGATPVPPAVPGGAVAVYEVYVPAAAASSAAFPVPALRLFRRAPFPWSAMNGIIAGCRLTWDLTVNPSTTSSGITFGAGTSFVVIDGEVIDCSSLTGIPVIQDSAANPFGVAAGASDKPYYIYVVGGRHAPQGSLGFGGFIPVAIVESLTPPNLVTGSPTSSITTPRGAASAAACLYIGIGFVLAGTTRRHACQMGPEMTYIVGSAEAMSLTKTIVGTEALGVPGSKPTVSTKALVSMAISAASGTAAARLSIDRGDGGGVAPSVGAFDPKNGPCVIRNLPTSLLNYATGTFFFAPGNATIWQEGSGLAAADVITANIQAYDHRVRKFSPVMG